MDGVVKVVYQRWGVPSDVFNYVHRCQKSTTVQFLPFLSVIDTTLSVAVLLGTIYDPHSHRYLHGRLLRHLYGSHRKNISQGRTVFSSAWRFCGVFRALKCFSTLPLELMFGLPVVHSPAGTAACGFLRRST